jgi:uncharacterized protein YprB with RNaseH-like and TPR domain
MRELKKTPPQQDDHIPHHHDEVTNRVCCDSGSSTGASFAASGWASAGHLTLRREITDSEHFLLPTAMPDAAGIVMPGIDGATAYEDLLFFDLETTGLSGGAGTLAFLAAFGRLVPAYNAGESSAAYTLCITQYLLLDYPGEYDFVEALLGEFKRNETDCKSTDCKSAVTMVSYNGKSFDSQILKTRCLMNGIMPPEYRHADLLYPSRRLWKRLLPDCSQGTVETNILGIDRSGDIPGALAPEIWFSFLKTGDALPLLGICEHNRRDIAGLAAMFSAMAGIAADPCTASIMFDFEMLAIRWHEYTRRNMGPYETGRKLLQIAAERGHPRAELVFALSLLRSGNYHEGREWLAKAASADRPLAIQAASLRALAIDSERRLKNNVEALALAERGLELLPPDTSLWEDFERRVQRLKNR